MKKKTTLLIRLIVFILLLFIPFTTFADPFIRGPVIPIFFAFSKTFKPTTVPGGLLLQTDSRFCSAINSNGCCFFSLMGAVQLFFQCPLNADQINEIYNYCTSNPSTLDPSVDIIVPNCWIKDPNSILKETLTEILGTNPPVQGIWSTTKPADNDWDFCLVNFISANHWVLADKNAHFKDPQNSMDQTNINIIYNPAGAGNDTIPTDQVTTSNCQINYLTFKLLPQ